MRGTDGTDRIDEQIYAHFRETFPDLKVDRLVEDEFKSEEGKAKWRGFVMQYEKKVQDYNFGTLLRLNAHEGYTEANTMFVTRMQFYCIEIARNREGLNSGHFTGKSQ